MSPTPPARAGRMIWALLGCLLLPASVVGQAEADSTTADRTEVDSSEGKPAESAAAASARAGSAALDQGDVERIGRRHLDLVLAGNLDSAAALYGPDVFFIDPTTDVFDFELATGVEGRDETVAVQRSWGIESMQMELARTFVSGSHSVYYGPLSVRYETGATAGPMPYVMILRVGDGLIRERTDFGDYVGYTERVGTGAAGAAGAALVRNARAYMEAYGDQRFEDWRDLFGSAPVFQDPTLEVFGPEATAARVGADAIIDGFIEGMASVTGFGLTVDDAFFTPGHAVFLSTIRTTVAGSGDSGTVQVEVPMVTALTFENSRVVGHRDYWDAEGWMARTRAAGGG